MISTTLADGTHVFLHWTHTNPNDPRQHTNGPDRLWIRLNGKHWLRSSTYTSRRQASHVLGICQTKAHLISLFYLEPTDT